MEAFMKVAILENYNEASLLDSILKERNIPYHIKSYHDTAFDGLFQTQKGWGHLSSPAPYHNEIIEILSDLRKTASETV